MSKTELLSLVSIAATAAGEMRNRFPDGSDSYDLIDEAWDKLLSAKSLIEDIGEPTQSNTVGEEGK